MVAFLAHETARCSGEIYTAGGGPVRPPLHRLDTRATSTPAARRTIEDVAEHWAAINDETGYSVPADLIDWSRRFLSHLDLG